MLADYGVKCTFFVVGNWADQYPEQAKAIVESGNELMNHSNAHEWDVDSLDWKGISAAEITKRVTGKVTNGSIVLFHNAGEHTPEALPDILDYLLGEGYEIVPISKILLTNEETYIDHTGRQCQSAKT